MFKRIFFSIEIPQEVKEELLFYQEDFKKNISRGVKWVEKENIHITLGFLGSIKNERINLLIRDIEEVEMEKFFISLKKISYFPPIKRTAKLIWVTGESDGVYKLQEKIEEVVVPKYKTEKEKNFNLHLTLGKIKSWDFSRIPTMLIPEINEEVNINFEVSSFNLVESKLKKEGPDYNIIKRYNLK